MAFLVHPLPPVPVYVKKEYLYDLEKGHGELTPGIWISVKSTKYKALYIETLLTDYGALFDKLPKDVVKISESGFKTPQEAQSMKKAGFDAVLIGESLVRSSSPKEFIQGAKNES